MYETRTGGFSIGIRRGWSDWQKDLTGFLAWNQEVGCGVIDFGNDFPQIGSEVQTSGIQVGSVDLKDISHLYSKDESVRKAAVEANMALIEKSAAFGATRFFVVVVPPDSSTPRAETLAYAIESFKALAPALEKADAKIVIEGWPGAGAIGCTPESYRAILDDTRACIGINFDPSHLIRMNIDPMRFLNEFADRVYHAHGKDTAISHEAMYEFGTEQPATLAKSPDFGGTFWRYTIPGHGQFDWAKGFAILAARGYTGAVSIELEDANFNGTEAGEKAGLLASLHFLASA